jgi:uncharacterized membrane protein
MLRLFTSPASAARMFLAPLLSASVAVQFHVAVTLLALSTGAVQLVRKRRDGLHRTLGWTFVVAMASAALSSFFIHNSRGLFGLFSPIHLLSILTLVMLPLAVWYARRRNVRGHRIVVLSLFWFGLVIPGALTLVPGRIMHAVVFGGR